MEIEIPLDDFLFGDVAPTQQNKDNKNESDAANAEHSQENDSPDSDVHSGEELGGESDSSVSTGLSEVDFTEEQVKSYYDTFKALNVLDTPDDFEFDGTVEGLEKAIQITKDSMHKNVATALWNKLPEEFRPILEYGLSGGTNVKDFLGTYTQDVPETVPDNVDGQKRIIFDYYKTHSKKTDEAINKIITRLEKDDELESTADEVLSDLRAFKEEERERLIAEQEQQVAANAQAEEQRIKEVRQAIKDSALDDPRKNKINAFFFNPTKVNGVEITQYAYTLKNILSNPKHLVQLADVLMEYSVKDGFDLSRFEARVKTKAANSFKQILQQKIDPKSNVKGSGSVVNTTKDNFDWSNFLRN